MPTKFNKRLRETEREIRVTFKNIIERKEKEIKRGRANDKNSDLLRSILNSNAKQIKEQGPDSGLSVDDLIDDCKAFYLAGQSATSSLFVWTLVALSQHQDWQTKARDEISQAFGNNEPDFEGLNHLKVVSRHFQNRSNRKTGLFIIFFSFGIGFGPLLGINDPA